MIDFVKLHLIDFDINEINPAIEIEETVNKKTGELRTEATFHTMKLKVYSSGRATLHGSLHKFYNSIMGITAPNQVTESSKARGFNGNSFNHSQLCYSIDELCTLFGIRADLVLLSNLEIGVNLIHPYNTRLIITNLIRHRGAHFVNPKKYFYQAEHTQFYLKCYDKAWQYGMSEKVMRYELKIIKVREISRYQITSLNDLKNKKKIGELKELLIQRWSEILMFDYTIDLTALQGYDLLNIDKYRNKDFWNHEMKPNRIGRHKERLQKITFTYSEQIQNYFTRRIELEWLRLLNA